MPSDQDMLPGAPDEPSRLNVNYGPETIGWELTHWGLTVAEYRVYIVGLDGHFLRCQELVCPDDREALVQAKRLLDKHDIEIWNADRLVTRLRHLPT